MTKKSSLKKLTVAQKENQLKPLFMWTGGKRKVLPKYKTLDVLPSYKQFDAYVEPFFGGGAVFCDVVNSGFDKEFAINDLNMEMMYIYFWIREAPTEFIRECQRLLRARNRLDEPGRKTWYYTLREKYWEMPDLCPYPRLAPQPQTLETAATLYVLMLTGFNGFWQVKKTGKFTGKFGAAVGFVNKQITIDPDLIQSWSQALARARLFSGSYQDIEIPQGNALIFVDPPYRESIMTYGRSFTDEDQQELVRWCIEKSLQNHTVLFSNRQLFDHFFNSLFREGEDEHYSFAHNYVKGTKGHELLVVLEPERLKRHQVIIDGKVFTFSVKLLTHILRDNPIIKELGLTANTLLQAKRRKEKAEAEAEAVKI